MRLDPLMTQCKSYTSSSVDVVMYTYN